MQPQLNRQHNNVAFVLGNGKSRLLADAKALLDIGVVYGCNAIYRELSPHYLIAVDVKMVNEIIGTGYNKSNEVWTNPNKGIADMSDLKFFHPHKGWSSGPTALHMAASKFYPEIYILGFDYQGNNGLVNNIYADTFNYKKSSEPATFYGNWLNQTQKTIKEFPGIQFYRVIEPGSFAPKITALTVIANSVPTRSNNLKTKTRLKISSSNPIKSENKIASSDANTGKWWNHPNTSDPSANPMKINAV